MSKLLYAIVGLIAKIHSAILTWNDSCETVLSDKQLHFLVIGLIGMMMLFVIFPLFKLLSKNHVLIIAWIYVFTVMIVLTFAIEIGQGITHTGTMDFDDIVFGLVGFMVMFLIFAVIRSIILSVVKMVKSMF
jgi:glycopeptide antibiotics resistance protein